LLNTAPKLVYFLSSACLHGVRSGIRTHASIRRPELELVYSTDTDAVYDDDDDDEDAAVANDDDFHDNTNKFDIHGGNDIADC